MTHSTIHSKEPTSSRYGAPLVKSKSVKRWTVESMYVAMCIFNTPVERS